MPPKTAAKGAARKYHKVLRDNIQGVTKPAITRLLRRAGVKRISGLVYDEVRVMIKVFLDTVVHHSIVYTQASGRKTVSVADLTLALSGLGIELAAGLNKSAQAGHTQSLQSCNARGKRRGGEGTAAAETAAPGPRGGKGHRFRPGTVSMREIRSQQKHSDCLVIAKASFNRLVREVSQNYADPGEIRFGRGVCELLQLVVEDRLVALLASANDISIHCGHVSLFARDIQLARKIIASHHSGSTQLLV